MHTVRGMEQAQAAWAYAGSFVASGRDWAVASYQRFLDVGPEVAPIANVNEGLAAAIQASVDAAAQLRARRAVDAANLVARIATVREENAASVAPLLSEYDEISAAKVVFDQIGSAAEEQHRSLANHAEGELGHFGYASKKLFALHLAVDALRRRMADGRPFSAELGAFMREVDGAKDLELVSAPVAAAAEKGLPSHDWLAVKGHEVALALGDAASAAVVTSASAASFFDRLKFRISAPEATNAAGAAAPSAATRTTPATPAAAPSSTHAEIVAAFTACIGRRDYGTAILRAEDALGRVPHGTAAAERAAAAVGTFRAAALPVAMSSDFLDFCDASVTTMRYSFVEPLLLELTASEAAAVPSE